MIENIELLQISGKACFEELNIAREIEREQLEIVRKWMKRKHQIDIKYKENLTKSMDT
jgi:hypothetical protein